MTEAAAATAPVEMTRVQKVRVQIRADSTVYEGYVHLLADTSRVMEVLNDPRPFLNITEVVIHDRNDANTVHSPYVALNKGAITHVVVLSGDSPSDRADASTAGAPKVRGAEPTAVLPAAARRPTLPSQGPKTMPAPPPKPIATRNFDQEPPTQPFPRGKLPAAEDDDVSDLILDDDGADDVDPDDLERDVGALITSSSEGT